MMQDTAAEIPIGDRTMPDNENTPGTPLFAPKCPLCGGACNLAGRNAYNTQMWACGDKACTRYRKQFVPGGVEGWKKGRARTKKEVEQK